MAEETLADLPVAAFLERLAAGSPTPGGGSAAALAGALAAALGRMVAALTLGKPRYAAVAAELHALAARLARAQGMLRRLMDEDAAAYSALSAALKLDAADPQRAAQVADAAGLAARVPLETAAIAAEVGHELERLAAVGNPRLRPDVEAGLHLARAAVQAAAANVRANLPQMAPEDARVIEAQLAAVAGPAPA